MKASAISSFISTLYAIFFSKIEKEEQKKKRLDLGDENLKFYIKPIA